MRITKTPEDIAFEKELEEKRVRQIKKANEGCWHCPCCGETLTFSQRLKMGEKEKGILKGLIPIPRPTYKFLFFPVMKSVDIYKCYTCGAEWESDPF